ncbi:protamine 2 [Rattus norvegicus]|uniref:Protamine 2 n=1 Tax=Rattus norvegicus TaxID=10116 RepID=A6K4I6_RAT|nr:protamine 2 [Rattus norvegicus]
MGGQKGATTTDTGAARGFTGSTRGAGHAEGGGDTPAATGGGIAEAAEDPEGGGAAGAGNAGGTIIKPPQVDPFCLELRKSPASGSHLPKQSHVRPQHHSMLISEP